MTPSSHPSHHSHIDSRLRRRICLLLLVLHSALSSAVASETLRPTTEDWPPFNYAERGAAKGLGVEIINAIVAEAKVPIGPTEFYPWNRAYALALKESNRLIFTMGRTAQREPLFHWVARIAPREIWLYRLRERSDIAITDLEQAKRYVLGVGPAEDASTQELLARGFKPGTHLDSVHSADPDATNIRKLLAGRFDLLVGNPISIGYALQLQGVDPSRLSVAYRLPLDNAGYWVALSKPTPPGVVQALTEATQRLEKKGELQKLRARYLGFDNDR